ncbi:uncharacterized protein LOC132050992 [Lycium ferocissimum]|uniref:uncharacterized protein LOC132050992 n=1 Tax=Lycium ferocissimum TaxID=112874 RepID=UPI0028165C87|nr:uncharacterized protein LOC132050992 [Lycium ferocissimum]
MAKLMRLVDDVIAFVTLLSLFLLIVTPIALGIEDSYDSDVFLDDIEGNYNEDLYDSSLYSIPDDSKPALSPEPYPGFQIEVEKCLEKISDDCGWIIFSRIVGSGYDVDLDGCCSQLLTLGRKCHNTILESTLANPEMKGANKTLMWENSDQLWKECAASAPV